MKSQLLLVPTLLALSGRAAEVDAGWSSSGRRARFEHVLPALTEGRASRANGLIQGLENHPLYKYFRYRRPVLEASVRSIRRKFRDAAAAYNTGPEASCVPARDGTDTIPFSETRRHVGRILFYAAGYAWRRPLTPAPFRVCLPAVPGRTATSRKSC